MGRVTSEAGVSLLVVVLDGRSAPLRLGKKERPKNGKAHPQWTWLGNQLQLLPFRPPGTHQPTLPSVVDRK